MTEAMINLPEAISKSDDTDFLRELIQDAAQRLMEIEVGAVCGAGLRERTPDRGNQRNGYRPRRWDTRAGTIGLNIPKLRKGSYFPTFLEPRRTAEKALMAVVQEAYIHGVSTRAVDDLVRAMGLTGTSKSQVSRLCEEIDERVQAFLNRPLEGDWPFLWLDATYVKLREGGGVVSMAVIVAVAVNSDGRREILGITVMPSEAETFWADFLRSLTRRGLRGVQMVISDAHEGLKAAASKVLGAGWQRCRVGPLKKARSADSIFMAASCGGWHDRQSDPRSVGILCLRIGSRDLVPDDHILARVDRVIDLGWLRAEVADLYAPGVGRPGIDPEAAVRLMLAGFLLGIVHDRRLLREAQVNLAIRWFAGFGLNDRLPDHSSLTRIRQRWGADRFRRIFERTVRDCVGAGIAKGEVVHVDASLIRADVSWESLVVRHVDAVATENGDPVQEAETVRARNSKKTGKFKKVCLTDPDASMATSGRNRRLEPSYKQHGVVDDVFGVVLDVEVTTGEVNEGEEILARLDAVEKTTGTKVETVTADAGYAYAKIYGGLERRKIAAVIPAKAEPIRSPVPMRRFRYDAKHDILKCPRGKKLKAGRAIKHGRFFTSRARDCRGCDLARLCLSKGRVNKAVVLGNDYPALLRARRRRERWSEEDRDLYQRHRWRSEGYHGEAKTWHGLARAVRRGLQNMRIQAFLTAAAVNLKRLAAALCSALARILSIAAGWARSTAPMNANGENQPDVQEREPAMAA